MPEEITAVALSDDHCLMANAEGVMGVWQLSDGAMLWNDVEEYEHRRDRHVVSADFTKDGLYALTAHADDRLQLWRLADSTVIRTYDGPGVRFVRTTMAGPYFVTATEHTIAVRHLFDGATLRTIKHAAGFRYPSSRTVLSRDGRYVAAPGLDSTANVWRVLDGELVFSARHDDGQVDVMFISANAEYVSYAVGPGPRPRAYFRSVDDAAVVGTDTAHFGGVGPITPDNRYVLVAGQYGNLIRIADGKRMWGDDAQLNVWKVRFGLPGFVVLLNPYSGPQVTTRRLSDGAVTDAIELQGISLVLWWNRRYD